MKFDSKLVIFLVISILILFEGGLISVLASDAYLSDELAIGVLVPLTGSRASRGEMVNATMGVAVEDVNLFLEGMGSTTQVRLMVEDTATDPAVALEGLKRLKENGVVMVVGPQTSSSVEAVREYAQENGMIILGYASTAPSLAIPGDSVFRLVPDDTNQAEATSTLMWMDGIRVLVPLWRGDIWGDQLANATRVGFESHGGVVMDGVRYDVGDVDYAGEVEALSDQVAQAIDDVGAGLVAVHLIAFDEGVDLLSLAANDSTLSKISWYGSDATSMDRNVVRVPVVASFVVNAGLQSPNFGVDEGVKFRYIQRLVRAKTGNNPEASVITAYDALWLAVLTYQQVGTDDFQALVKALPKVADFYYGSTGRLSLNDAGDRAVSSYDFWSVKERLDVYQWEKVARYYNDPEFGVSLTRV